MRWPTVFRRPTSASWRAGTHSEEEEWRLLYVAMTRATYRLVLGACGESGAVERVAAGLGERAGVRAGYSPAAAQA